MSGSSTESRRRRHGQKAESLAARYLAAQGFEILELNARAGRGELDIVARDGAELVFVEVRSRRRGGRFAPEATVGAAKRRSLAAAAALWLARRGLERALCRFDVVAVDREGDGWRLRHLPAAFVVEAGGGGDGCGGEEDDPGQEEPPAPGAHVTSGRT